MALFGYYLVVLISKLIKVCPQIYHYKRNNTLCTKMFHVMDFAATSCIVNITKWLNILAKSPILVQITNNVWFYANISMFAIA